MSQDQQQQKSTSVFAGLAATTADVEKTIVEAEEIVSKTRVVHGANERYFDNLVGKEVGMVRKNLKDLFNIPGDASALVDGKAVGDDFILGKSQTLEFFKEAGTKG